MFQNRLPRTARRPDNESICWRGQTALGNIFAIISCTSNDFHPKIATACKSDSGV
jgi:hypothetical protein